MAKLTGRLLEDIFVKAIKLAVTRLPDDVKEAMDEAIKRERSQIARRILSSIIENYRIAEERGIPMCQDTGTLIWYLEVGRDFPLIDELKEIIVNSARRATVEVPIRPNSVDPFTGRNSGDNTGRYIPWIEWDIVEGERLKATVLPKGGGSEYTVQLRMVSPGLGLNGVKEAVLQSIFEAGGKPCPPIIVGVGIGGGADIALKLGKKAILRPITSRHEEHEVARFEEELLDAINSLGIGPMGLGGDTTALAVNIEYAYRHPATLPVGIVTQCWAARRTTLIVGPDEGVEILSHRGIDIFEVG